jgi:hypothetical protein
MVELLSAEADIVRVAIVEVTAAERRCAAWLAEARAT